MKKILGISAFYHDSAAAITIDGKIIAAAQEERFSRIKNDAAFPLQAIDYCLKAANLQLSELDAIVFYDKPLLKFERIIETYFSFAPKGWRSFLASMPSWLSEKLFLKKNILKLLSTKYQFDKRKMKLLFTEHHLSHAASSFFASPFQEAAILTMDGVGEWTTTSIGIGNGNGIKFLKEIHFPHSLGLLYSAFTYFLGFKVNSGEYKVMGLAPFGNAQDEQTKRFISIIKSKLVTVFGDGSFHLNQDYFSYATSLRMVMDEKWKSLFGIEKRIPESELLQAHCNLALAVQQVTEEIVMKLVEEAKRITGSENLCLSGGVALNCVANGKISEREIFKNIFVQPASGDAGGALGAALAANYIYFEEKREVEQGKDAMQGALLGPEFSENEIAAFLKCKNAVAKRVEDFGLLCEEVAASLHENKVVGWFQGRMEFGPRALGNRSILANPLNVNMQEVLNLKIKFREGFRPFAPVVLEEFADEYFDLKTKSPYMLFTAPVKTAKRIPLPTDFDSKTISEKLRTPRSQLQSITHVDFSARVQTVGMDSNIALRNLLKAFHRKSNSPVLINTSFNVRGEPLVCTPEEAYNCFMKTDMDYLVLGNFVLNKKSQSSSSHS